MSEMVSEYSIPTINVARNAFVKNFSWKGDCKVGLLYPVFFDEVLPGDTKQVNGTFFGRINPTVTAPLDNVWLDIHYFYVPNRLVWDNWQKFMGERIDPGDSIDFLVPTINSGETGFTPNELLDYLSVPPSVPNLTLSSIVFYLRAYNLIWNEWYRSELLQDSVTVPHGDDGDSESIYKLLPRGKRQDYFTSSFTTMQLGAGASLPLGTIQGSGSVGLYNPYVSASNALHNSNKVSLYGAAYETYNGSQGLTGTPKPFADNLYSGVSQQNFAAGTDAPSCRTTAFPDEPTISGSMWYTGQGSSLYWNTLPHKVDVRNVASALSIAPATINSLRQAIAIQQFLERDLCRGTRYVELLLSHYGVRCPDFRLQRPEYLGGSTTRININPVTQTSSTDATSPQGNISGNGVIGSTDNGFTMSFTEHGVVLGLASFRVDLNYQQGVDRHFLRNSRYDYFFPDLAHLGMQSIYNKEIYAQGDSVKDENENIIDNKTFGYNMRYEEYRYKNSYITGTLRSSHSQSLDIWHLAEDFSELPVLNDEFIVVSDTLQRIMTVQNTPEIILDAWFDYTDIKEVPMYGLPGLERI